MEIENAIQGSGHKPSAPDRVGRPRPMLRMRGERRVRPYGALALGLVALVALSLLVPVEVQRDVQPFFTNPAVPEIYGETTVGQSFVAAYPGLERIEMLVGTHARRNDAPLVFRLREDGPGGRELASVEVNPATLPDNQYTAFPFLARSDSAGRPFYFSLEAPDGRPGNAITVWAHRANILPQGTLYVGEQPTGGDLAFHVGYRATPAQLARAELDLFAARKPGVFGLPGLYAALIVAYLVVLVALVRALWRVTDGDVP
ncbi:MAG: hypothetical protein HYY04_03630 [Chloroflexi bacterium]|nr:hypothetical protein [Chloroflexota bacterium]